MRAIFGTLPGGLIRRAGGKRRMLLISALIALVAGAGAAFGLSQGLIADNSAKNGDRSSSPLATVTLSSISSRQLVDGTLGHADKTTVVAPAGTNQPVLNQAQQQVASAQAALSADQATAADSAALNQQTINEDQAAVTTANNQLTADQAAETADCSPAASPPRTQSCSNYKLAVARDQTSLTQAQNLLANAQLQARQSADQSNARIHSDQVALQNAQNNLSAAQATAVNPGTTYTGLPVVGQTVSRGQALYSVSGIPVPLFYGPLPAWRSFVPGMSDGPDVGELNANLIALGFGSGLGQSDHFSASTAAAIKRWQASIGAPQTGSVTLGSIVFEPDEIIVSAVTPVVGAPVQPGAPVLQATSTREQVVVNLDAALQADVKVGDPVTITLPSNKTTPGVVSSVGTVAASPSGAGGGAGSSGGGSAASTPTVEVDVSLSDPSAAGNLDQAPVQVSITTTTVDNVLVVPVAALLAMSGGGDAVEVVEPNGNHRLIPVHLGLFDDADGLVQVSGSGLAAGQRVVVPQI